MILYLENLFWYWKYLESFFLLAYLTVSKRSVLFLMIPSVLSFLFINLKMGNYLSILINQTLIINLTFNHLLEIIRGEILSLLKEIYIEVIIKVDT